MIYHSNGGIRKGVGEMCTSMVATSDKHQYIIFLSLKLDMIQQHSLPTDNLRYQNEFICWN